MSDPQRLRDVLAELGDVFGVASPAEVAKVWGEWKGIVGPGIAAHADPTSLRDGVLGVRADSPTWATELGYLAGEIKTRVNRAVGEPLVREVKVWVGPRQEESRRVADEPAGRAETPRRPPGSEDPEEALARAHEAWARYVGRGPRRGPSEGSQNQEKPR